MRATLSATRVVIGAHPELRDIRRTSSRHPHLQRCNGRRAAHREGDDVRLTIIGSSGSFPGPDSPASSYLVEADGFRLLLDLGYGSLGALQRHIVIYFIDAVFISNPYD